MSQWVYTDVVKDHFMNPRNLWDEKENFEPDGVGEVGSLACGDQMRVGIKVENDKIASSLDIINYAEANNINIGEWIIIKENHRFWKIKHYRLDCFTIKRYER